MGEEGLEPSRFIQPTDFKSVAYTNSATRPSDRYEYFTIGLQTFNAYSITMKRCTSCRLSKDVSEYFIKNSKSGLLHSQCKSCYKEYRKNYYREHYAKYRNEYLTRAKQRRDKTREQFRNFIKEYLSDKKCECCGISDPRVLEMDHISSENKLFSISQGLRLGYKLADISLELQKCRVLCTNCHRIRTAEQFNWRK